MWERTGRRAVVAGLSAVLALGAAAVPAIAGGGVARGDFHPLAAAEHGEPDIAGRAQVVRVDEGSDGAGRTHVDVTLRGLRPGASYGVHLHNAPCSASNPGGGHYMHDPAGPAVPPNEAWPSSQPHNPQAGITANAAGNGSGRATANWLARPEAQSVVVHARFDAGGVPAGGPKIACADLR